MSERNLGQHHLAEWREARGISQRRLADDLPNKPDGNPLLSYASISRIEQGKQPFPEEAMAAVADILGVTVQQLFEAPPENVAPLTSAPRRRSASSKLSKPRQLSEVSSTTEREEMLQQDILRLLDKYGIDDVYRQIVFVRKAAQISTRYNVTTPHTNDPQGSE